MDAEITAPGHRTRRPHGLPSRLLGDEHLAQEAGAGSERAFTALFQRYHQQLYRYCRGLTGTDQDAQDALQTTFTKALVALRADRRNAPLRPWLYRIAHNESISLIRSRNPAVSDLPLELEAAQGVVDSIEQQERMAMLLEDLRELPEQQRGALVMRELSGLSHEEIAAALQVSVGAAKQSILEARRSLLEFAEGRAMTCDAVQRIISDDDRRSLRSRRVRAHLRDCGVCAAFAEAIPRRRADMLALWPALPATSAAGLLAKITGAGSGHGGGGAGLAAGTAAKGVGATISLKAAAAAGAAAVATATVGAVAVLHHATPVRAASGVPGAASHTTSGSTPGSATTRVVSITPRGTSNHRATTGKGLGPAAGKRAAGHGSHGKAGAHGSGVNANGSGPGGQGHGAASAPGHTNRGHTNTRSTTVAQHAPAHVTHRKTVHPVTRKHTAVKPLRRRVRPKRHAPVRIVKAPVRHQSAASTRTTAATPAKTTTNTQTKTKTNTQTKTKTAVSRTPTTQTSSPTKTTGKTSDTTTTSSATVTSSPAVVSTSISTAPAGAQTGNGNGGAAPGQSAGSPSGK